MTTTHERSKKTEKTESTNGTEKPKRIIRSPEQIVASL